MRALRVVGLTEDGEVVLEDPVRLERFKVPADERLRAAARGDLSRLGQIAIELESQLRPREIQARIRAGASVEQVAAAAGVPEQKIERFAYPVLLERFRTAENAQRAHPVRADGPDSRTLAEVVAHTFGLRGQAYEGARWDSWKGEDGRWVVALSWRAGRSDNRAHWTFQPGAHGGTVTALDEHASDLVEGLPARPLRTVGAVVDMNRPEEEPPPAPSPVEQWRAAASDSYRERVPHGPEPGRPAAERGAARTAEPWRPAPAQRQGEPVDARPVEQRGTYRGEARPAEPRENGYRAATSEWAPGERGGGVERREAVVPAPARPESPQPQPARSEPMRFEPARSEPVRPEPGWAGPPAARTAPAPGEAADAASAGTGEAVAPERERDAVDARPHAAAPPIGPPPSTTTAVPASPAATEATEATAPPAVAAERTEAATTTRAAEAAAAMEAALTTKATHATAATAATGVTGTAVVVETVEAPAAAAEAGPTTQAGPAPAVPDAADATAPEGSGTAGADAGAPATAPPVTGEPTAQEPTAQEPAAQEPAAQEPAAPAARRPRPQEPAAASPAPQEPAADAPAAGRRTRKGKPVMPSWDEVLLGVRGPR
jgi:hypothetical protein